MNMKNYRTVSLLCLAAALLPAGRISAQDPVGTVSYALPQTTITIEVEAVREYFYAGPYAKYAQKHEKEIAGKVLADALSVKNELSVAKEWNVNGENVKISVERV